MPALPPLTRRGRIYPRDHFELTVPATATEVDLRIQKRLAALATAKGALSGDLDQGLGLLRYPTSKAALPELTFEVEAEGERARLKGAVVVPFKQQVFGTVVGCVFLLLSGAALFKQGGLPVAAGAIVLGALTMLVPRRIVTTHPYEGRVLLSFLVAAAFDEAWTPPPRETTSPPTPP